MPSTAQPPTPLRLFGIAGTVVLALVMSGCTQPDEDSRSASPSTSVSPSVSPSASIEPESSPSAAPAVASPVEKSCLDLVSLQAMYDFDPNFGLQDPFVPAAGSRGAAALGYDGVACSWVQQTSGATLEISVASPPPADLATLMAGAGDTSDGRSYSTADGPTGVVQVFDRTYWIVVSSTYFIGVADAASLADSVTAALP